MKTIKLIILFFSITILAFGQENAEITGSWLGKLNIQTAKLRVIFNLNSDASGKLLATMDSPDQGAKGLKVDEASFVNNILVLEMKSLGVNFTGAYVKDSLLIKGIFTQGGYKLPFELKKSGAPVSTIRKQEPSKPYPYKELEVNFENAKDKILLAGTLTMPENASNCRAVVLVTGSGSQNRDEEIMGHKPFLIIADYLTRQGIAVLRYDDRGVGKSNGTFANGTTADFANDADAAIDFLKKQSVIDPKQIGIIGHSEGGEIAAILAAARKDLKFAIMLAGPCLSGSDLLILQTVAISKASNIPEATIDKNKKTNLAIYDIVKTEKDNQKVYSKIFDILKVNSASNYKSEDSLVFDRNVKAVLSPWFKYFLNLNPADYLKKANCAVLALNGEKDLQVPYKENLTEIAKILALSKYRKSETMAFPNLNHLFQECTTGLPAEYGQIEETFNVKVLEKMASWIKNL